MKSKSGYKKGGNRRERKQCKKEQNNSDYDQFSEYQSDQNYTPSLRSSDICSEISVEESSEECLVIEKTSKNSKAKKNQNAELQSEKIVKMKLMDKLSNFSNKILYPPFLGPHPMYTMDNDESTKSGTVAVQLRTRLSQWINNILSKKLAKQSSQNEQNSKTKSKKNRGEQKTSVSKDKKTGLKYNKYSLEFKKQVVRRIQLQLSKKQGKSLRYHICREAKHLKIHPKNITRWFETKDLDRREGGRKAQYPILQYKLSRFIKANPFSKRRQIVEQAKRILKQLEISQGLQPQMQHFSFSKGWYQRFRIRMKQKKVQRCIERILYQGRESQHKLLFEAIKKQGEFDLLQGKDPRNTQLKVQHELDSLIKFQNEEHKYQSQNERNKYAGEMISEEILQDMQDLEESK